MKGSSCRELNLTTVVNLRSATAGLGGFTRCQSRYRVFNLECPKGINHGKQDRRARVLPIRSALQSSSRFLLPSPRQLGVCVSLCLSRRQNSSKNFPTLAREDKCRKHYEPTPVPVLVVDEIRCLSYGPDAANVLFHVVNHRHLKKRPMIFTTNKPLNEWGKVLHDEDLAAAILDRVLERGRFIQLDGVSSRTRHRGVIERLFRCQKWTFAEPS
jgi:IstB-like ATP binding protein